MKKTMLWGAIFTLMSTQLHAEGASPNVTNQASEIAPATQLQVNGAQVVAQNEGQDANNMNQVANANNQQVAANDSAPAPQNTMATPPVPTPPTTAQPSVAPAAVAPTPTAAPVINCDYKIPATTKTIEPSIITSWSEKATAQAFQFDPTTIDAQMQKLQNCFTDQGWVGFKNALQKSGNIDAIKTQKLKVTAQLDGQAQITETKDNQWKVSLPLQVLYQNDKEKVTQVLNVNLTVGRKINGDLGIMQLIAMPRVAATAPTTPMAPTAAPGTPSSQQPGVAAPQQAKPGNATTPATTH